ncbi:MAG: AAA family ATPase [Planctomycetes bacterium]|nr:AAA family ATPase [Planctomycetota bacterium]
MWVSDLDLINFRGFERLNLTFEEDVTVIAGHNGVGKSSILYAISRLLANILPMTTYCNETRSHLDYSDIKIGKPYFDSSINYVLENDSVLSLHYLKYGLDFLLNRSKTKKEYFINYLNERSQLISESIDENQIVCEENDIGVYYNIHRSYPIIPKSVSVTGFSQQQAAYTKALSGERIALKNSIELLSYLEKTKSKTHIYKSIKQAIYSFLPEFSNIQIILDPRPMLTMEKDGDRVDINQMSDGEKGVLSMVIDLARRLAIANPKCKNSLKMGKAVVLIDEIELHLHPNWQRSILHKLQSTFENCQFILTTHSPQVLGEVEARCIRCLYRDEESGLIRETTPIQSLGLDSSEVLEELMDGRRRNDKIEIEFRKIDKLITSAEYDDAQKEIDKLVAKYGSIVELVELQTELDLSDDRDDVSEED